MDRPALAIYAAPNTAIVDQVRCTVVWDVRMDLVMVIIMWIRSTCVVHKPVDQPALATYAAQSTATADQLWLSVGVGVRVVLVLLIQALIMSITIVVAHGTMQTQRVVGLVLMDLTVR